MASSTGIQVPELAHNSLGVADIAVQTVFLVLGLVAVCLRVWSRHLRLDSLQFNDWLIVAAMVLVTGRYFLEIFLVLLCGAGLHTSESIQLGSSTNMHYLIQLICTSDLLRITAVCLIQVAVLHHFLQRYPRFFVRWPIHLQLCLCIALWMASLVATAIVYAPHKLAYLDRHRSELQMLLMGTSITEVILNGFVVASSILILRNAVLTTAQEIVVACIYVLASRYHPSPPPHHVRNHYLLLGGILTRPPSMIIISAIRIKIGLDINPQDLTFDYTRISLLSTVVLALGLLSSCLPLLSPAAGRIFQTTAFSPPLDAVATSPILLENRETTIVLGLPADGRPTPMVTITMPPSPSASVSGLGTISQSHRTGRFARREIRLV
ncbi:hypothetical protein POX_e07174 [Penicillium oxalicum]|uniref:hypothetical protein n=1 Tax=Penicillium oxalicum TaxID=69781 RepID=UPI0020B87444|nr:hypothetical protein POX_e07174 [Penicillium oxalicum]KAI2789146.1 hypothetical protein POX_e07174 [Penicillium oxalicum]